MNSITVLEARMTQDEDGYLGHVVFMYADHPTAYEITLHSKRRKDWSYSLSFSKDSGKEEHILQLEELLEEDDELFDQLVEAASHQLTASQS